MPILYGAVIGGKLYRIDTATGAETVVGDGVDRNYVGIAVDVGGYIYASAIDGNVYKFDLATGSLLRTYATGRGGYVRGICLQAGVIVVAISAGVSIRVNAASGAVSSVGSLYYSDGRSIRANSSRDVMMANSAYLFRSGSFDADPDTYYAHGVNGEGCALAGNFVWVAGDYLGPSLSCVDSSGTFIRYPYTISGSFWGAVVDSGVLYLSATGGRILSRTAANSPASLTVVTGTNRDWQDICIATNPNGPPDAPAFYGSPFEGFEAGTVSVEIDRKLTLVDTLGGRPVLIPYAPADKDEWLVTAEFWTSAEQAREIEMRTPPRGAPVYPGISVPARSGENTFAGLAPAATNGSADTYIDPIMLQPLEVLGQKAVRVDLYGYRASFSLSCSSVSNPYSSNPATPPTTTPPAWLPNKWRVHSIEDGSNERRVIGPDGKWTGSGNPIAANAIRPLSIQCDHLTTEQANELVAFFRGIRGNLFNLGFYPGPVGVHIPANPDFVATKLVCNRDAGLLWSATLEVVAA